MSILNLPSEWIAHIPQRTISGSQRAIFVQPVVRPEFAEEAVVGQMHSSGYGRPFSSFGLGRAPCFFSACQRSGDGMTPTCFSRLRASLTVSGLDFLGPLTSLLLRCFRNTEHGKKDPDGQSHADSFS